LDLPFQIRMHRSVDDTYQTKLGTETPPLAGTPLFPASGSYLP